MNKDEKHIPTGEGDDFGDYKIEVTNPGDPAYSADVTDADDQVNPVDVTDPEDAYSNIVSQYFHKVEELIEAIAYLSVLTADNVIPEDINKQPKHLNHEQLNFLRMIIRTYEMTDSLSNVNAAIESFKRGVFRIFQEMIANGYFNSVEELNEVIAYLNMLTTKKDTNKQPKHLNREQHDFLEMIIETFKMTDSSFEVNAAIASLKNAVLKVFQDMDEEDEPD